MGHSMDDDKASTLRAQLADLQAENNQLRGYLDSATAMLMIERNAQAGGRPRPS